MTKRSIGNEITGFLALAALHGALGCADPRLDEQADIEEPASHEGASSEILAQRSPAAATPSGANAANAISVASVGATGPGCPGGSWNAERVPEGNAFTITFEKYVIEAPVTQTPTSKSLTCTFNLQLRTPKNLSYAVTAIQYYGYANLSTGMTGRLVANYTFRGRGNPTVREFRHNFAIPTDGTYVLNDQLVTRSSSSASAAAARPNAALGWAPCDYASNLQVKTTLAVDSAARSGPGMLTMDNLDGRSQAALKVVLQTGACSSADQ